MPHDSAFLGKSLVAWPLRLFLFLNNVDISGVFKVGALTVNWGFFVFYCDSRGHKFADDSTQQGEAIPA